MNLRIPLVLVAVAATAGMVVSSGLSTSSILPKPKNYRFAAAYKGTAVVKIQDNTATISSVAGLGTATVPVGRSKLTGLGKGIGSDPCGTFGGPGAITTPTGRLNFVIAPTGGTACPDQSGEAFSVSGRATFKGGTRKYLKAKGTFKFTGAFTKSTGAFTVKFLGTLTA
ncbi:MAG: hypothetical protein ACM3QU_12950 [Verrucomicrobiota bacterium]